MGRQRPCLEEGFFAGLPVSKDPCKSPTVQRCLQPSMKDTVVDAEEMAETHTGRVSLRSGTHTFLKVLSYGRWRTLDGDMVEPVQCLPHKHKDLR